MRKTRYYCILDYMMVVSVFFYWYPWPFLNFNTGTHFSHFTTSLKPNPRILCSVKFILPQWNIPLSTVNIEINNYIQCHVIFFVTLSILGFYVTILYTYFILLNFNLNQKNDPLNMGENKKHETKATRKSISLRESFKGNSGCHGCLIHLSTTFYTRQKNVNYNIHLFDKKAEY